MCHSLIVICQQKSSPVSLTQFLTGKQCSFTEFQLADWSFAAIELMANDVRVLINVEKKQSSLVFLVHLSCTGRMLEM